MFKYTIYTASLAVIAAVGYTLELITLPVRSTDDLIIYIVQLCLFGVILISTYKAYQEERAVALRLQTEERLRQLSNLDKDPS